MENIPYKILFCEKNDSLPDRTEIPETRGHFMACFVEKGKGVLEAGGRTFSLDKGRGFILFPHHSALYYPDRFSPWQLSQLGFDGPGLDDELQSWGINPDSPLISFDDTCRAFYYINEIIDNSNKAPGAQWRVIGNLFKILGEVERFTQDGKRHCMDSHIKKALNFMESHYTDPISVADICSHVCLERSYFSRLFKDRTGESPRDYLQRFRMDKAMELLISTTFSVETVGRSVGYTDPLHFSRNFKIYAGCSPTVFRSTDHEDPLKT